MTNSQQFNSHGVAQAFNILLTASPEVKQAFAAGYKASAYYHGYIIPEAGDDLEAVTNDMKACIYHQDDAIREVARRELKEIFDDEEATLATITSSRAAMLDVPLVTDDGRCCSDDGTPLEDQYFHSNGKSLPEWPSAIIHDKDGNEVSAEEYSKLSAKEKAECSRVPYIIIKTGITGTSHVTTHNRAYFEALIMEDMAKHPGIATRYACEIGITSDQKKGKLHDYADTVVAGLLVAEPLFFTGEDHLAKQLKRGYITSLGELHIAALEQLALETWADSLPLLSEELVDFCLSIVESRTDRQKLDAYFPQADRYTYRDHDGKHLKKMQLGKDGKYEPVNDNKADDAQFVCYLQYLLDQLAAKVSQAFVLDRSNNDLDLSRDVMKRALEITQTVLASEG